MNWIREAINDSNTGKASSKRIAMLLGSASMAAAVIILSVAATYGHEVSQSMWAACTSLAALGGASYIGGKMAEKGKV